MCVQPTLDTTFFGIRIRVQDKVLRYGRFPSSIDTTTPKVHQLGPYKPNVTGGLLNQQRVVRWPIIAGDGTLEVRIFGQARHGAINSQNDGVGVQPSEMQ
jgi:hypothetical protein